MPAFAATSQPQHTVGCYLTLAACCCKVLSSRLLHPLPTCCCQRRLHAAGAIAPSGTAVTERSATCCIIAYFCHHLAVRCDHQRTLQGAASQLAADTTSPAGSMISPPAASATSPAAMPHEPTTRCCLPAFKFCCHYLARCCHSDHLSLSSPLASGSPFQRAATTSLLL